jgi:hypothetical protein
MNHRIHDATILYRIVVGSVKRGRTDDVLLLASWQHVGVPYTQKTPTRIHSGLRIKPKKLSIWVATVVATGKTI